MRRAVAAALAAVALAAFPPSRTMLAKLRAALAAPVINDVSTDVDDAPRFADGAPLPESFAAAIKTAYPDLAPLSLAVTPVAAHAACVAVAKQQMAGWEVTGDDEAALTVTAVATTPLMRFKDDIVVRVRPAPKGPGAVVDVRSRSRLGKGDLGANAARIRAYLKKVAAAAAAQ